jgi:hypothetical protein
LWHRGLHDLHERHRPHICFPEIVFDDFHGPRIVEGVRGCVMDGKKKVLFDLILLKTADSCQNSRQRTGKNALGAARRPPLERGRQVFDADRGENLRPQAWPRTMKRKLTLEELAQVEEAYDEEGDVGALLVLMKLMGMEDYHGEYEVQWRVNYDKHGGAVAELNVLGKGTKWNQIAREP